MFASNATLRKLNSELTVQMDELKTKNEELKSRNKELVADNSALVERNAELVSKMDGVRDELAGEKAVSVGLKAELETAAEKVQTIAMDAVLSFTRLQDLIDRDALKNKRVFIRADLNVPQDDAGNITEDTRIRASVPAIRQAPDAGAAVMVTSHLGRPTEGEFKPEDSLAPVAKRLSELLGSNVREGWV